MEPLQEAAPVAYPREQAWIAEEHLLPPIGKEVGPDGGQVGAVGVGFECGSVCWIYGCPKVAANKGCFSKQLSIFVLMVKFAHCQECVDLQSNVRWSKQFDHQT